MPDGSSNFFDKNPGHVKDSSRQLVTQAKPNLNLGNFSVENLDPVSCGTTPETSDDEGGGVAE